MVEIVLFSSGNEVIHYLEQLDILILKVEMDSVNGIEVKNYLEYKRSNTKIIFLSESTEKMQDAFGMNVCAFLKIPIEEEQLLQNIRKIWNYMMEFRFRYKNRLELHDGKIPTMDILYIESFGHYCELVCVERKIRIRRNIQELEQELNSFMFVRCHRSYIVNLYHIKDMGKEIRMTNGDCIVISRSRRERIQRKYIEFNDTFHSTKR